jgi:hypothetical protein
LIRLRCGLCRRLEGLYRSRRRMEKIKVILRDKRKMRASIRQVEQTEHKAKAVNAVARSPQLEGRVGHASV